MLNTEKVLSEIKRRVHERRQEGRYPAGLEEQLSAEFNAIISVMHRGDDTIQQISELLGVLESELNRCVSDTSNNSDVHKNKKFRRSSPEVPSVPSVEIFQIIVKSLRLIEKQLIQQKETDSRVLKQIEHAVMDRILMVDVLAEAVLELERKVGPDE